MGFRFRKSKKIGPFRINVSKSGIGWSVGTKGVRYTKRADGKSQTTLSIPGTGISYVSTSGNSNNNSKKNSITTNNFSNEQTTPLRNNISSIAFYKRTWFMWLMLFILPPVGIALMWMYNKYNNKLKIALSILFGLITIGVYSNPNTKNQNIKQETAQVETIPETTATSDDKAASEPETKLTGWQTIDNKTYYYDNEGNKKTGWIKDNNKYYFCDDSGEMKTGWVEDSGNWYYLNTDGTMATNTSLDGYTISSTGIATKEIVQESQSNSSQSNDIESVQGTQSNNSQSNNNVTSNNSIGSTVYIASSGKGKKYHSNPNCSKMKGAVSLTKEEAENRGYTPCSKCY